MIDATNQIQNTAKSPQNYNVPATGHGNLSNMAFSNLAAHPSTGSMTNSRVHQNLPHTPSAPNYNRAVQQRLMGDIRKRLEECIPESGFQYKPYVFSEYDFQVKMAAYVALNNRETPVNTLDDFPADPETQRCLVREIVEAMLNMDKNTLIDPEARLPVARIKKLSPFELDLMAWNVLIETRDANRGTISLPSWGKDWPWEEFPSFSARFQAVRKALYHCKAMVSSLFDEVFAKRLPLNPTAEFSRKSSNKKLNGKRKRDLEFAKGAKKDGFVPSNARQRLDKSVPPTNDWTSGPVCTPIITQRGSSANTQHKRRNTNKQVIEADHGLFNLEQDVASLADCLEQPLFEQNLTKDHFHRPTPAEIASGTDEFALNRQSTSDTGPTLASPFILRTERGRTKGIGNTKATHHSLPANDLHQWIDNTAADISNQETQQAIDCLDPELFKTAQVNPEVNIGNMESFQWGQKTSNSIIVRPFTNAMQPTVQCGQKETMPVISKLHQASEKDVSTPLQIHLPQYHSKHVQEMHGDSLPMRNIDCSASSEDLEQLLNMPEFFDPELGVWKGQNGETTDFSRFLDTTD
ncbi:hypothetical protein VMCG_08691 [Cytospora schulzeri]|uniref:Uncharacterized protein n=1 Tax=Cytospora schulzeri TaxID=448051 RepID=A0A423VQA0_9PEZI|nr:hypothetical protein VMCG_08691 [Valsa malicola]